jgi:hypothetical protein
MKKYYISGPISLGGTVAPESNIDKFHVAATRLRSLGLFVINPVENIADKNTSWADYMRCDLRLLLTCHGIVMLPRWEESKGARLEHHIARELGMSIRFIEEFA